MLCAKNLGGERVLSFYRAIRVECGRTNSCVEEVRATRDKGLSHQTLQLGSLDDVVVALKPLAAGQSLNGLRLAASSDIPAGHKLAIRAIALGQPVRKFNQIIGFATQS